MGPWPIGSAVGFSYEAGARILNKLRLLFDAAQRVEPAGTCTVADVSQRDRLTGGQFACYDPKPMFPSCPVAGSASGLLDGAGFSVLGFLAPPPPNPNNPNNP